ncbi:MAG: ABC transporter permease, partial [Gemmatimonadaceae bacterium]
SDGVLAVRLSLGSLKYDSTRKVAVFFDELQRRAAALPGVDAAGLTEELPLTSWGWTSQFVADGWPADRYGADVAHRAVSPGYFRTMRVPILRGRDFTHADGPDAPKVALINETLAITYFRGQNPIGRRVAFDKTPDSASTWYTIVGVVGDERQTSLADPTKVQITTPFEQAPSSDMSLVVHTRGDPSALGPSLRRVVHDLDPALAVVSMQTMTAVRSTSLARQRFFMTMLLVFAIVGLTLALVGVYGVIAQLARGRRREVSIRIALGASIPNVRWLIVRHGLRLVVGGLVVGLIAAFLAARGMRGFLYGVSPSDAPTFVAVPLLLLVVAAAAAWIPAVRASRADPAQTLREE